MAAAVHIIGAGVYPLFSKTGLLILFSYAAATLIVLKVGLWWLNRTGKK